MKILGLMITVGIVGTALAGCADVYYREADIDRNLKSNSFILSHGEMVRGGDLAKGYSRDDLCCERHYHCDR